VDTFVVRLWTPADHAAPAGDARGIARHVGTGRWATFRDGAELLALLGELPQLGTTELEIERADADLRVATARTSQTPSHPAQETES
jgi:hypothetical protein